MPDEITWRFLLVDDKLAEGTIEFIAGNRILDAPDTVTVEPCTDFKEALGKLNEIRIDLVILDLKDDSIVLEDDEIPLAGEKVFDQIRTARFVPVVFYTAYANKVRHLENPYVRVVAKGEERQLRDVIREIFGTGLPRLIRHIENEQRMYMWDQVQDRWQEFGSTDDKIDLTYLLARRLANTLQRNSVRRFLGIENPNDQVTTHPVEMYIYPPIHADYLAGDIVRNIPSGNGSDYTYWIVLTPSCDFAHGNATRILLAECLLLEKQSQYANAKEYWVEVKKAKDEKARKELKQTPAKRLKQLLKDNHEDQPERYKFLPGTFFLPDLLIDFQSLLQVSIEELASFERIASLDNPFAEACLSKFSRYYGRLGTPDLDIELAYDRLFQKWSRSLKTAEVETKSVNAEAVEARAVSVEAEEIKKDL